MFLSIHTEFRVDWKRKRVSEIDDMFDPSFMRSKYRNEVVELSADWC